MPRGRKSNQRKQLTLLLLAAALAWWSTDREHDAAPVPEAPASLAADYTDDPLWTAWAGHHSNVQIESEGVVERLLADDRDGSRHQRFILRGPSGTTVLVAHNIDLAPRVPGLAPGVTVRFHGEYEWNERGGVIHWTHRAPREDHPHGWIEYRGRRYQ